MLSAYGIDVPATTSCLAGDAVAVADAIGYPVAVKAQHRHLGRSARAGVALDLGSADDVTHALAVMEDAIGDDAANVVVQQMVPPGSTCASARHLTTASARS